MKKQIQENVIATRSGRVAYLPMLRRRLSDEQVRAAMVSMPDDDPRWCAVNQVIADMVGAAMLDVSDGRQNVSMGTYAGGRLAALLDLQDRLWQGRTEGAR
ncbi:MAG: hypothetical protein LBK99_02590 [Opitutaceae bacterium]|nr:hypothetical protein [Opitutaceae bacterium]